MSVSNISSSSSSHQTSKTRSTDTIEVLLEKLKAQSSTSTSGDTVTISVEALQALMQSKQDGPPPPSNEQAAKMGADIQKQNADLFTQIDTDEDGVLSADEAEAGKDAIGQAIKDGSLKPPEKPEGAGGPGAPPADDSTQNDLIAQLITALSQQGLSNAEVAKQLGTTEQTVQEVLQAS